MHDVGSGLLGPGAPPAAGVGAAASRLTPGPGRYADRVQAPPAFYRSTLPPKPLRHVIDSFWIYDGYAPSHVLERVLPTTSVELLFPLGGKRLRWRDLSGTRGEVLGSAVSGPRVSAYDVPTDTQHRMMGVHLLPGGAWSLLGVPVDQLAGPHRPLEDLLGPSVRELIERLEEASDHQEQFSLLSAYFLEQYRRRGTRVHPVVERAVRQLGTQGDSGDSPAIAELVASSGLSHRRFVEVFRREMGLTPRDFRRGTRS
jgi:AraC-like DNA-binding protein